jgi:hypothetical protein
MLVYRAIIAIALILLGAYIIVRMVPFPIAQSLTGIILGIAMIALGVIRLRQIMAVRRAR